MAKKKTKARRKRPAPDANQRAKAMIDLIAERSERAGASRNPAKK